MSCCDEYCANHGCNQGRNCPVRKTREEIGEPFTGSTLDITLFAIVLVFAASCLGYLIGGFR